jgi:acetyl esterase/lipase
MDAASARAFADDGLAALDLPAVEMASVVDLPSSPPIRVYEPHGATGDCIVYFHGGGGALGSVAVAEPFARYLAHHTRCAVASVEYRLAPEHKHPAAIIDACAAWDAIAARVPAGARLAVAGDSFGAFLATYVERHGRRAGHRRADLQVLVYPLLDLTLTSASVEALASGYLLTKPMMCWFRDQYANPEDDPAAASPWFWTELAGAAPAVIATAGFDPLVDDGRGWAARLAAAGTAVHHRHHASLIHGFVSLAGVVRAARAATDQLCADVASRMQRAVQQHDRPERRPERAGQVARVHHAVRQR